MKSRVGLVVEFKPFGNWNEVSNVLSNLPKELESSALWGQRKAGEELVRIVKKHLAIQDLNWTPLAPSTIKRKGHSKILIDTYAYYSAIETWQKNKQRYVGVKNNKVNSKGKRIANIAAIHEIRSYKEGKPYRALWGPSVNEMGGGKGIARIIEEAIFNKVKKLKAKGIEVTWN